MIGMWLIVGVALAAAPECAQTYPVGDWVSAMDRVDGALSVGDPDGARPHILQAHRGLLCLDGAAEPEGIARLARQLALAFFFDQDEESVRRWGLLSRYAADLPWDAERFPPGQPFRAMLEEAEDPGTGGPADLAFAVPKHAAVFLNGQPLEHPVAPIEVPGLLQVVDQGGAVLEAAWVDGSAFPEHLLGPPGPPPRAEKAAKPPRVAKAKPPRRGKGDAVVAVAPSAPAGEPAAAPDAVATAPSGGSSQVETTAVSETRIVTTRTQTEGPAAPPMTASEYVDPFTDARRRALVRSVSERELVGPEGAVGVVRTEVITFVSDPSGGALVTQEHFATWLLDFPEWAPGGQMARHRAGEGYLPGWSGGRPPAPDQPVTGVSFHAAQAYCGSWGNRVASVEQDRDGALREWRRHGENAALLERTGAAQPADPKQAPEGVGFRCAP